MAAIPVQNAAGGLANATFNAAAAGDTVAANLAYGGWEVSGSSVVLSVKNGSASAVTVGVGSIQNVSVPASGQAFIPVDGGLAATPVTYSATASVTVAAIAV